MENKVNNIGCIGEVGLIVPCRDISFYYVAKNLEEISDIFSTIISQEKARDFKKPKGINATIRIDEAISSIIDNRAGDVYWVDTPCIVPYSFVTKYSNPDEWYKGKIYVTSEFNKEHMEDLGFKVDGVVGRIVHPNCFSESILGTYKPYDIIFIGKFDRCDRKNLFIAWSVVKRLGLKSVFITNKTFGKPQNITVFMSDSLSENNKLSLIRASKFLLWTSFCEGFGMPVLEAMACGTVPIYTNVPAHNEFAEGIPIEPIEKIKTSCYGGYVVKWVIDEKDVEEAVKYAMGLSKDEYMDLREKCIEKAIEVQLDNLYKFMNSILGEIDKIYETNYVDKFNDDYILFEEELIKLGLV